MTGVSGTNDRYLTLLPRPRRAEPAAGTFELGPDTDLCVADGAAGDSVEAADAVRLLLAPLRLPLRPAAAPAPGQLRVVLDEGLPGPEGYRLTVRPEGVEIVASDVAGARHATQVLRQLLPDDAWRAVGRPGTRWVVGCGEVTDRPALSWRGGMLDVSRHFFTKHTVLRHIDLLAMHRFNRLHLHLTDDQGWRIASPAHPELTAVGGHRPHTQAGRNASDGRDDGTPHGGVYTLADLSEIAAYAAERGITVVPEIDLPGHASALLASHPELGVGEHRVLAGWGISGGVLRPVPAAVGLLTEVLDELMDAVPGPYLHLGGDECVLRDWPADPETAAYMAEVGVTDPAAMHGHFLRELAAVVAGRGRRAVVWDEAFVTGGVRDDTVVMAWRGDGVARRAAAAGHQVVRSPVFPTYFDYDQSDRPDEPMSIGGPITLDDVAAFRPLPADWSDAERDRVVGAQFQMWAEYIPDARHLDYMAYPRASLLADAAWNGEPTGPAWADRLTPHLARLDAAGCEYRPPSGPRPWQAGGTGDRARRPGARIDDVRRHLEADSEFGVVAEETTA